jgi:hypothetical protein
MTESYKYQGKRPILSKINLNNAMLEEAINSNSPTLQ